MGLMSGLVRGSRWIARLAALNLLWIAFTLLGLVVGGVMPATAAVFGVLRRWALGEDEVRVVGWFWHSFRAEFWRSNALGYILAVLGYLLYTDFAVARMQTGVINVVLSIVFIIVLICYLVALLYAFPLLVHLRLSILGYLRWSLALGLGRPLLALIGAAGSGLFLLVAAQWAPLLLPFLGISLPAWLMTWCTHRAMSRIPALRNTVTDTAEAETSDATTAEY